MGPEPEMKMNGMFHRLNGRMPTTPAFIDLPYLST